VVAGIGANALIGGSNRTVTLQPFSVQGQVGLNVAAGVAGLDLRWVRLRDDLSAARKYSGHPAAAAGWLFVG